MHRLFTSAWSSNPEAIYLDKRYFLSYSTNTRCMRTVFSLLLFLVNAAAIAQDRKYPDTIHLKYITLPDHNLVKKAFSPKIEQNETSIQLLVQDIGMDISKSVIDKIFQPFFTSKPTGEGTGMGLSLSYDIITKEHNGTISVESKEGEGSLFVLNIPKT
jgi:signal transduction histidine kinase